MAMVVMKIMRMYGGGGDKDEEDEGGGGDHHIHGEDGDGVC